MVTPELPGTLATRWRLFRESLRPRVRELRFSLHLLRRSPLAVGGLFMIFFYLLLAALGPYLPLQGYVFNPGTLNLPPSMDHPLGTDPLG